MNDPALTRCFYTVPFLTHRLCVPSRILLKCALEFSHGRQYDYASIFQPHSQAVSHKGSLRRTVVGHSL
nr:MAG TPA_asm: hypothetical protein [Caudoviricetes sp.]